VRRLVVRRLLVASSAAGALAGLAGARAGAVLLRSLLYQVPERDLPTFGAVLGGTLAVASGPATGRRYAPRRSIR